MIKKYLIVFLAIFDEKNKTKGNKESFLLHNSKIINFFILSQKPKFNHIFKFLNLPQNLLSF